MTQKNEQRETARAVVAEWLQSGQTITPARLATEAQIVVPVARAHMAWVRTYCRSLVHEEAERLGIAAMAIDGGYKRIDTAEDAKIAAERAAKQLQGMRERRRRLEAKISNLTQMQLDLTSEGGARGGADAAPGQAAG